ncbi:MAG: FkbM family methyltransferase [Candidatus Bathyarchaeia archaeon]
MTQKKKLRLEYGETSYKSRVVEDPSGSLRAITLDEIVKKYGEIDLLKLDVEVSEVEILLETQSKVFSKIRMIVAEMHSTSEQNSNIVRRLKGLGYDAIVLDPPIFNSS